MPDRPQTLAYRSIDTRALTQAQGEDAWRDVLTPVTKPERLERRPFGGRIDAWLGASGMFCDIQALAQITRRDAAQLAVGSPPLYLIMLMVRGTLRYNDCERDLSLVPGDVLIEDMSLTRLITTDTMSSLQLIIPQDDEEMPLPPGLHGQRLPPQHPATRLLARHLMAMRDVIVKLTPEAFERYQKVARALLLAALSAQRTRAVLSHLQQAIRAEVIRHVDRHLTDPQLTTSDLSKRFQISRSQLYRLFQETGGASAFIRYRRLCWAAQQIACADCPTPDWLMLADELCFPSVGALQKAFRKAFDMPLERFDQLTRDGTGAIQEDPVLQLFQRLPDAMPALSEMEG